MDQSDFKRDTKNVTAESYNKFCTQCGHRLTENSNFCPNCGFKIQVISDADNTFIASEAGSEDLIELKASSDNKNQQTERKTYTDDDPTYAKILSKTGLLSSEGRRGRLDYFKVSILLSLVSTIGCLVSTWITIVVFFYPVYANVAKRLHDLNRPTRWAVVLMIFRCTAFLYYDLLVLITILTILPEIYIIFVKGTTGPNDYGPDPLERVCHNDSEI